jgi:hypothetical protein
LKRCRRSETGGGRRESDRGGGEPRSRAERGGGLKSVAGQVKEDKSKERTTGLPSKKYTMYFITQSKNDV